MTHYGFWNFCGDHPFLVFCVVLVVYWTIVETTAVICRRAKVQKVRESAAEHQEGK